MNQNIEGFLNVKKIAVVGASRKGNKFGNLAAKELVKRGYEVFYVHPETAEIDGQNTYPNLAELGDLVDMVWVNVPAEKGSTVLQEAAAAGLEKIWLQQGADSPGLNALGRELGLTIISGKCILMYAEPVRSYHKFHQLIWKLFGQY